MELRPRTVATPEGAVTYQLTKKRVKNFNLRIKPDGTVLLSVPTCCRAAEADEFIRRKSGWLTAALQRLREPQAELLPARSREESFALLRRAVEQVYPRVAPLGVAMPVLKLRTMKTQWGNCHWTQGYITLNTALVRCPEPLREYVALHELVHFLHPNHGPGFHGTMDRLMPDWRARRCELRRYQDAISQENK